MMPAHFDVFEDLPKPFSSAEEATGFLIKTREKFNVQHLSYWFFGTSSELPDRAIWQSTYPGEFISVYMRDFTPQSDPIFRMCLSGLFPRDWVAMRSADGTVNSILEMSEGYGIGKHGISFPIRGPGFGEALFSVNADCDDGRWTTLRKDLAGVFQLFAQYFHMRMKDVVAATPVTSAFDLSRREREVLLWAAAGKTAWETGSLIGISESAIRHYTANAMTKLHAHTKAQAVAIAVKNGIIQ